MSGFGFAPTMYERRLLHRLRVAAAQYPVVSVLGPRQSGKTTLVRAAFPEKPYVSLEDVDLREYAAGDPRRFLRDYPEGAVFDEVQRVPDLLSYVQGIVDERDQAGFFVLTGSQNLHVLQAITQSLAGRVSLNTLLPLAVEELRSTGDFPQSLNELLFTGLYPRIYDKKLEPTDWLSNYTQTYVERDVRQIKNVGDLASFARFVKHCAGRSGQLLNLSALANDCGINHNTAKSWLSILEASYLVFLLQPYYRNFDKRLKKSAKLYFFDTGLLCFLLGIRRPEDLSRHASRGAIFESFILSEIVKAKYNRGLDRDMFFWQDKVGNEIDCVLDVSGRMIAVEIKSGETIATDFFKNLRYWRRLSSAPREDCFLVYAGESRQDREECSVLPWLELYEIPL